MTESDSTLLWPFLAYTFLALTMVGGMLAISYFLGQRHQDKSTGEVYESGLEITGSARLRFPIHFYIIAMFFVIFDLEAVFVVAWAVSFKETGWLGYWAMLVFMGILMAVFVYEWRIGALDFGPNGKKILKALQNRKNQSA